jgi:WhiB family redox-sensing transcriptional regulator
METDLFFPVGTAGPALAETERARRICQSCPARAQCLDWALENGAAFAIWGGRTEDERRSIRQRLASARHAEPRQVRGLH